MKTPVVLFVHRRPKTTKLVLESIKIYKPSKLYIFADGPKDESQVEDCRLVRKILDQNINWDCQLERIYSKKNNGLVKNIKKGLDYIFEKETKAIILEDDTLPNLSFFKFCEELLEKYKSNNAISHISGCNFHPDLMKSKNSYTFSSIINIWGWATWERSWKDFDINISKWSDINKTKFLEKWIVSKRERNAFRKMFDLHCNNIDPWTWDYQWSFHCWNNNGISIMPKENLVTNIGFGKNATNTCSGNDDLILPKEKNELSFPLIHPVFKRDIE